MTTEQRDPVTLYARPVAAVMAQVAEIVSGLGIPCQVYGGTNMDGFAAKVASVLTQSGGRPAAVVCFGHSVFGNHPRRTTYLNVVVVSSDTRPSPGMPGAIEAAWAIEGAIDRLVTQDTSGECPQTDLFEVDSEEGLSLKDAGAACAVAISLTVKDY